MDWDWFTCGLMRVPRAGVSPTVQVEVEDAAFAGLGFEPDAAAVAFDDFLDKGEPDAGAGFRAVGCVLKSLENAKYVLMKLRVDANAVVLDVKDVSLRLPCRVHRFHKSDFDEP